MSRNGTFYGAFRTLCILALWFIVIASLWGWWISR